MKKTAQTGSSNSIKTFYIMKSLIFALIFALSSICAVAQSGWESGNYYLYRGQAVEECGFSYPKYDMFGNWVGNFVSCHVLYWERKDYGGYINVWNGSYWATQWHQGYAWYCYWSPWYEKRVW